MKKWKMLMLLAFVGAGVVLTACGKANSSESKQISVVSREEGSGTRGAFIDLFGLEEKNSSGDTVDLTTANAIVTNSTSVTLTTVAGDDLAIGYASLGSLNDSVKVLKIDGTKASVETIKDGSYKISRPFNIVTKEDVSKAAKDFINFILSSDGQAIVEENGYIPLDNVDTYQASVTSGKVVISGSSSVTPVMEKLKEAYTKVNSGVTIEIQQSDSSTGITDTIDGTSDIGMASRELEDSEIAQGVNSTVIAMDGIAVIVNKNNTIDNLTSEQVKSIFSGEITTWKELSD
ncbi:phosphate ABC transporter substrate-binding protein, PhoT family (TC 3.A.1.7.1) [Streptococcus gallolyticus]|uniref:Phosphate ABC transporter substrate-binding protein, PhoT family (TC 3.A.1.7.1) n=1 Tax=Streptococcus gallolyticus TaxID=315405 RepID=A0A1H7VPL2_9STRE|nr:substrate-binding domain-containing protein [Streptococcus gallolyticus]SEF21429.1 phosphate transport system substrate-binding protein [Streptococcus gallolyticus]SEM11120.1 phosphate ABC transporter substrate-binding protein, PhoT family (TC 3.A.1.7.1) [Streptococcus gallolyticus]